MRIAELSRESGVPIPTIKYYLREGLIPAGERTSPNQAQYDARHLRRLRLIRALIDVGGVPVAGIRELLDSIDAKGENLHNALGTATHATLAAAEQGPPTPSQARAGIELDALMAERDWDSDSARARQMVINALATFFDLGEDDLAVLLPVYADAAALVAEAEVGLVSSRSDVDSAVEGAVIGTVIGEQVWAGLRRLAQEHYSNKINTTGPDEGRDDRP
ncbi:MerR family transcriptional regulator [Phytomonospora endophytica]|uniref:DNA-binding transcriptional MerR regulator n=1 Tax=Phytomonospora endophytica TaxID=714109 RepID=A0A841FVI2_9ACTN|nr:MerR family transcriptional regulator [Phytomonospora endophytica]MBB6040016.1 DNA-binding transcriptional MerR regulator [Phytomonospora endophytica]GIG67509.1 MerR family transcriptional regulator [Phytomonospora endophytica]